MKTNVLEPLGITRSTFVLDEADASDIAEFFDERGAPATHDEFAALATASLYTATNGMTRFLGLSALALPSAKQAAIKPLPDP